MPDTHHPGSESHRRDTEIAEEVLKVEKGSQPLKSLLQSCSNALRPSSDTRSGEPVQTIKPAVTRAVEVLPTRTAISGDRAAQSLTTPRKRSSFAHRRIHLIGIGGCGMSGLARMLTSLGATCRGSDANPGELTAQLQQEGVSVRFNQQDGELDDDIDLVIASAAIRPDHPEMIAAQTRGIPTLSYPEALGKLQHERTGISIAGTHGKSTTTAMLCHVLIECGFDPGFIVGATCPHIGGGSRVGAETVPAGRFVGQPGLVIGEACEFNRSFHHHRPLLGLINNIEEDHLDIYGSLDAIIQAFREFAELIPPADEGGWLLIAHEGAHRRAVASGLTCQVQTFGFSPAADVQVIYDPAAQRVGLLRDGYWLAQWTLTMPGEHNALNAAAAAIIANRVGADWQEIAASLSTFPGIDRRMQRLGQRTIAGGVVTVYDDYGHHPTEIEKTLAALRNAEQPERLICVFQPHQHSRTRFLLDQFAESFSRADLVIVPQIYFVRDSEIEKTKVSACDLVDRLRQQGVEAMHLYPFAAIVEQLEIIARPGDLIVIMGAGPVWQVARDFLRSGD